MTEAERQLKRQLDQNTAALARMQMQQQHQNSRQPAPPQYEEPYFEDGGPWQGDPYGPPVDTDALIMQAITKQAATDAAKQVGEASARVTNKENNVKKRMDRLVSMYPALSEDGSEMVQRARQIYSRIAQENPQLDEATRYELAAHEAATSIGARPVNMPAEFQDWTMGPSSNPALPSKGAKSRLTPEILANARLMGINVDPKTPQGQKNLKELSGYSARFNADQDETSVKYR